MTDEPTEPELQALLDLSRADDAVKARIRERWLRRQASEDATFPAVLADLSQRGLSVSLRTSGGRTHQGVVVAVGEDFCTVRTVAGVDVHIALRAVAAVRPQAGFRLPAAADAPAAARGTELDLVGLLARALADRPRVHLAVGAGDPISGELEAVGADIATLRLDDGQRIYVALESVLELSFLASG